MKLHFYGGAGSVTGANYLLEEGNARILVDCGLVQGSDKARNMNYEPFAYDPGLIDAVILTHAHLDHLGRIPLLYKRGFHGKIFTTPPTCDFARISLEDAQEVMAEKAEDEGKEPLYSMGDVHDALGHFEPVEYHKTVKLAGGLSFRMSDAGHILGSAIIELFYNNGKIVFSGDLGHKKNPFLCDPETVRTADYILIESAYGDRVHESRRHARDIVEETIEETIHGGGVLMIPAFAIERTQELLYHLNYLVENKRIPSIPIYLDSPLAIKATRIYGKYTDYFNKRARKAQEIDEELFDFPGLKLTETGNESRTINRVPAPKVIIAGSGMSEGGRIWHHEKRYLPDPRSCLLIVGYQVQGTLGRELFDGARQVRIYGEGVKVRARIKAIGGYSAHADQHQLTDWLSHFDPDRLKRVFVVQGEHRASVALARYAGKRLGINMVVPQDGDIVDL